MEKAFLLNEEFQKPEPRSLRMTRHLYDLERLMDTEFGKMALSDMEMYGKIVEHRRKFYHVGMPIMTRTILDSLSSFLRKDA